MVQVLLITFSALIATQVHAEILKGKIHSVVPGTDGVDHQIRMESGRVVFMKASEKSLLPISNQNVEIVTDEENNLVSIQTLATQKTFQEITPTEDAPQASFEPTVIEGYKEAEKIFNRLNSNYQRVSQCFNRAHVWSRDEFEKNGIKTMKTFVFFTTSYIAKHKFNWWFHVAPMLHVKENDEIKERVLDFRYTSSPVTVREWTEMFVYSKRSCVVVSKYSEFFNHQDTEDCYVMNVPMYYWQPRHIEEQESENRFQTKFNKIDVSDAYSEAFVL